MAASGLPLLPTFSLLCSRPTVADDETDGDVRREADFFATAFCFRPSQGGRPARISSVLLVGCCGRGWGWGISLGGLGLQGVALMAAANAAASAAAAASAFLCAGIETRSLRILPLSPPMSFPRAVGAAKATPASLLSQTPAVLAFSSAAEHEPLGIFCAGTDGEACEVFFFCSCTPNDGIRRTACRVFAG